MSSCLFGSGACPFPSCSLYFASSYDVIAHIEDAHMDDAPGDETRNQMNVRPSSIFRLFPKGYKPEPIPRPQFQLSFEYYKKKPTTIQSSSHRASITSESEGREGKEEEGEEAEADICEERRYKCQIEGCDRKYKNLQGVKYHMRSAHGHDQLDVPSSPGSATSSPSKYSQTRPHKCGQCSKRYKTQAGLQNHIIQTHQKAPLAPPPPPLQSDPKPIVIHPPAVSEGMHPQPQFEMEESHPVNGMMRMPPRGPAPMGRPMAMPYPPQQQHGALPPGPPQHGMVSHGPPPHLQHGPPPQQDPSQHGPPQVPPQHGGPPHGAPLHGHPPYGVPQHGVLPPGAAHCAPPPPYAYQQKPKMDGAPPPPYPPTPIRVPAPPVRIPAPPNRVPAPPMQPEQQIQQHILQQHPQQNTQHI